MSAERSLPASNPAGVFEIAVPPTVPGVTIDPDRLWGRLEELGSVGAYEDARTGLRGVRRLALSDAEVEGRRLVESWMRGQGLTVTRDAVGNVYARREGIDPTLPPVMLGSHIDSVATAGRFDGCLGVLGGLEVLASFDEHGIRTRRPVVVAFFTDEEGVRFGTDMLGSAAAVGRLEIEWALSRTDRDGVSVGDELARHDLTGPAPRLAEQPPYAYLECHIEQGPVLLEQDRQLGVVTGVQGISWWRLTYGGSAAHAGCTPMSSRRDAGLALSSLRVAMDDLTGEIPGLLCNFGLLATTPGLTNVVPDTASATIDLRHPEEERLREAEVRMQQLVDAHARDAGCEVLELEQTARTAPVVFHPVLVDAVETEISRRGIETMRLVSGAGHDAQELASVAPSAMIFVRGQNEGVSHSPREYSTKEDCAAGVAVLATLTAALAGVDAP